jgi:uncharacterized membrane protein YeaQ/YmgE (transglycosylase-associated protein family)
MAPPTGIGARVGSPWDERHAPGGRCAGALSGSERLDFRASRLLQRAAWTSSEAQSFEPTREMMMINLIVWLIVGGVLGWIASIVMRTDAQQGTFLNIVVGIVGAGVAGFLISPMLGVPTINDNAFSVASLIVSLLGAVVLLAIINLFRRGRVR